MLDGKKTGMLGVVGKQNREQYIRQEQQEEDKLDLSQQMESGEKRRTGGKSAKDHESNIVSSKRDGKSKS